jgi:anti-sigma regulatory factor (Ser/Thr protein kinase)
MSEPVTLRLRNDLAELERLGVAIEAFGARHGLSTAAIFDVHLALDEILTNVISYGYDDDQPHAVTVRLSIDGAHRPRRVQVEVEDDGRAFNPLAVVPPDVDAPVEERPIGGLGIFLVRRVMDDLEYRRQQGKNVLVMRKALAD